MFVGILSNVTILLNQIRFLDEKIYLVHFSKHQWQYDISKWGLRYAVLAHCYPQEEKRDLEAVLSRKQDTKAKCRNRDTVTLLFKPWPNGVASRRKPIATPFGQALRALALSCDDLRSLWSRSNLHASLRKFFTVWPCTQPKSTQVEWRPLTYYQPMKYRICLPWNGFFATFVYLRRNLRVRLATQRKSLRRSSTCGYLRLLASPFDKGLKRN